MVNNIHSDAESEPIYDYYEKRKTNSKYIFVVLIFMSVIILAILELKDMFDTYNTLQTSENSYLESINDLSKDSKAYNLKYEEYFGKTVSGAKVKQLLNLVKDNNISNSEYKIGIDPNFTSIDGQKISGQNNSPDIFDNLLDENKNYIVCATDISNAYYPNGYIARISIADESKKSDTEILDFNNNFKIYFSDTIAGSDVKKLLSLVERNNNSEGNTKIRILFHVSGSSTTTGSSFYELSGVNTSMNKYIQEIKNNYYYFVNAHKTNPDGTISSIVISDNIYKHNYE